MRARRTKTTRSASGKFPLKQSQTTRAMSNTIERTGSRKSWVIHNPEDTTNESIMLKLMDVQNQAVRTIVPWFHKQMPASYFHSTDVDQRIWHLTAMTSLFANVKSGGRSGSGELNASAHPEIMAWSPSGGELLFISHNSEEQSAKVLRRSVSRASLNIDFRRLMGSSTAQEKQSATHKSVPISTEVNGVKQSLSRINKFASLDGTLTMWSFMYGPQSSCSDSLERNAAINAERALAYAASQGKSEAEIKDLEWYLNEAGSKEYVSLMTSPRRLCLHHDLYNQVAGTEDVKVHVEPWEGRINLAGTIEPPSENERMITIAAPNVIPKLVMSKVSDIVTSFDLTINGVHVDMMRPPPGHVVDEPGHADLVLVRFQVGQYNRTDDNWDLLAQEIKRLKWYDNKTFDYLVGDRGDEKGFHLHHAEVLSGLINLTNARLGKSNPHLYTRNNISNLIEHPVHWPIARRVASLFYDRFDPDREGGKMSQEEFDAASEEIRTSIHTKVLAGAQISEESATVLYSMLDAVGATLRTNLFVDDRYALSLRLDPAYMGVNELMKSTPDEELPTPFGTFYIHGRSCDAFHVRFRDISRGGLRVVVPKENHEIEAQRMYDEAYSLAFAQQLKNKDIPEGGSKAVCLVRPGPYSKEDPHYLVRKSVKAFGDALLDLNTESEETKSRIVDWYGKDEQIYLGPDENIIPEDITWLIDRAHKRGYPNPDAFMSSKPMSGINHKEFGVTSTGVNVFLDVALRQSLDIDPESEPFTVKMTGGTDGDVAGNCLRLLDQSYGSNARLVGICDGTATIEDPEGIDMGEILRLVEEDEPLCSFRPERSADSTIFTLADTPEGVAARNTMHNRVKADAFVPAGGRPNTINVTNYSAFLDPETGTPSSSLIVEGANLFLTPMARKALFDEAGVHVVKDSSANKCGVVTSSYEIMCAMVSSESEFLEHKSAIVGDVQAKLRHLARIEAELIFREFAQHGRATALPQISNRISHAIIRCHDAIASTLDQRGDDASFLLADSSDTTMEIIDDHLPSALSSVLKASSDGFEERVARVPLAYRRNIVASNLSSKIVYTEGLNFVEQIHDDALASTVERYLASMHDVKRLRDALGDGDSDGATLSDDVAKELAGVLKSPGIAAALTMSRV